MSIITVGELKKIIKEIPDDLTIRIQNSKYGCAEVFHIYRDKYHSFGDCLLIDNSGCEYQPKMFDWQK